MIVKLGILMIAMFCALYSVKAQTTKSRSIDCLTQFLGKDVFVRIEDHSKHFYIVQQILTVESIKELIDKINKCVDPSWQTQWNLSVFSNKELAIFKDDPSAPSFPEKYEMNLGYLAEYSANNNQVIFDPTTAPMHFDINDIPKWFKRKRLNLKGSSGVITEQGDVGGEAQDHYYLELESKKKITITLLSDQNKGSFDFGRVGEELDVTDKCDKSNDVKTKQYNTNSGNLTYRRFKRWVCSISKPGNYELSVMAYPGSARYTLIIKVD